jgi:hypothetical protein
MLRHQHDAPRPLDRGGQPLARLIGIPSGGHRARGGEEPLVHPQDSLELFGDRGSDTGHRARLCSVPVANDQETE